MCKIDIMYSKRFRLHRSKIIGLMLVVLGCWSCTKQEQRLIFEVGFNSHPFVGRGVFYDQTTKEYQPYFIHSALEHPIVYFFDLKGNKVDSITIAFDRKKNPNNIKFITKDSILYTVGNENANEFYLLNRQSELLMSKSLLAEIKHQGGGHEYYIVPFKNNSYSYFSMNHFTATTYFSPSAEFRAKHQNLEEAQEQQLFDSLKRVSPFLLQVKNLSTTPVVEMWKNRFEEKGFLLSRARVIDFKEGFYFYSPASRVMYEMNNSGQLRREIQLLAKDVRLIGEEETADHQKMNYVNEVLHDQNSQVFYVVVSIDNDHYDEFEIAESSFQIIRFDKNFKEKGSKLFDGERYNINGILLAGDKLLVEERGETYGQLIYEVQTDL